jgi:AcrR family transcriptional regulator
MNQSEERQDNIQRAIEAGLDMFMENGIAATSMSQIAKKVNLSQMSLYRYFGSKEELILRIWKYALTEFYKYFYERYTGSNEGKTGYERFVACMEAYYSLYEEFPNWYRYTHEMFTYRFSPDEESDRRMNNVFWKHYDKEIPIPALKALKDGVADGSIRADINIYAIYQILLNAYTGTTLYENISFGVSPEDIVRITASLIAKYIKNDQSVC